MGRPNYAEGVVRRKLGSLPEDWGICEYRNSRTCNISNILSSRNLLGDEMTEKEQKQLAEAVKDALRIIMTLVGLSPLAIAWQLWRNDDLWAHIGVNLAFLVLGYFAGIWHAMAMLHAIIVIFSYNWRDEK